MLMAFLSAPPMRPLRARCWADSFALVTWHCNYGWTSQGHRISLERVQGHIATFKQSALYKDLDVPGRVLCLSALLHRFDKACGRLENAFLAAHGHTAGYGESSGYRQGKRSLILRTQLNHLILQAALIRQVCPCQLNARDCACSTCCLYDQSPPISRRNPKLPPRQSMQFWPKLIGSFAQGMKTCSASDTACTINAWPDWNTWMRSSGTRDWVACTLSTQQAMPQFRSTQSSAFLFT